MPVRVQPLSINRDDKQAECAVCGQLGSQKYIRYRHVCQYHTPREQEGDEAPKTKRRPKVVEVPVRRRRHAEEEVEEQEDEEEEEEEEVPEEPKARPKARPKAKAKAKAAPKARAKAPPKRKAPAKEPEEEEPEEPLAAEPEYEEPDFPQHMPKRQTRQDLYRNLFSR